MYTKSFFPLSALSLGVLAAFAAQAQEAQLQPTVEVTASRVAQTVDASLADVSVITRADIEKTNAPDLLEVLRLQAGVDVARTGGAGQQTSVFLRGTNSNHVLVLIDGVRVASNNTGGFMFENLPLDAVERIEIVRGPRASYWGSDAIGGVIQIFTRKLDGAHVAASYGTYASADGSIGYGVQTDSWGVSAQAGGRHVDGFSASNPLSGPYTYNPDDNPFQNHNAVVSGWSKFGAQTLSATVYRGISTVSFDAGPTPPENVSRSLDQAIGINLEGPITDSWSDRLSLGTSRENLDTAAFGSSARSTRETLSWTNDFALGTDQHLTAGVDYVRDDGRTYSYGATSYDNARDNTGVFGGWRWQDNAFDTEISARYDHDSQFGSAFSGSVAAGYKLTDALRLTASYGTAFSAPSFSELYSPGYGGYYAGNPLLDPERSRTGEIGLDWTLDAANSLQAHAFTTRVHDLITFDGPQNQAINVDHAAIDGLELTHRWQSSAYTWTNTFTWQDPRDEDTGTQLLRRPKQKFNSVFDAQLSDAFSAGIEAVYAGRAYDYGGVELGAYTIFNLRATYAINPQWRIGARLENLGDKNYQLVYGYNTPGRAGYLTVSWSPGK